MDKLARLRIMAEISIQIKITKWRDTNIQAERKDWQDLGNRQDGLHFGQCRRIMEKLEECIQAGIQN